MEWIKCSDRMPEQYKEVIIITDCKSIFVASLNSRMTWDDGDFFDDIRDVTHWMSLPNPPQD